MCLKRKPDLFRLAVCLLFILSGIPSSGSDEPFILRHSLDDWSPEIQRYQRILLDRALMASESVYGPVKAEYISVNMTPSRWLLSLEKGRHHSAFVTINQALAYAGSEAISITPFPVLDMKLGLRNLIVHRDNRGRFSQIESLSQLSHLRTGQGWHWPEARIYKHAGMNFVEVKQFRSLFAMLKRQRFDYLPLSVVESEQLLNECREACSDLEIVDSRFLFYPLPMYFAVSKADARAAERLEYAKQWLLDGERYKSIYNQVFKAGTGELKKDDKVFVINNPYYSEEENSELIRRFFGGYPHLQHLHLGL